MGLGAKMNKILYDKISLNDNWVLVAQALIDKQAEKQGIVK